MMRVALMTRNEELTLIVVITIHLYVVLMFLQFYLLYVCTCIFPLDNSSFLIFINLIHFLTSPLLMKWMFWGILFYFYFNFYQYKIAVHNHNNDVNCGKSALYMCLLFTSNIAAKLVCYYDSLLQINCILKLIEFF